MPYYKECQRCEQFEASSIHYIKQSKRRDFPQRFNCTSTQLLSFLLVVLLFAVAPFSSAESDSSVVQQLGGSELPTDYYPGWNKRSGGSVNFSPGWGKRNNGFNKFYPDWGKRSGGSVNFSPGWGKRSGGSVNFSPGWGKRSKEGSIAIPHLPQSSAEVVKSPSALEKRSGGTINFTPNWGKRGVKLSQNWDKRSGGSVNFSPGWGKRSGGSVNFSPGWGKRSGGSVNFTPGWGKRSGGSVNFSPSWGKRSGGKRVRWGKRSGGSVNFSPGWGKRSTLRDIGLNKYLEDRLLKRQGNFIYLPFLEGYGFDSSPDNYISRNQELSQISPMKKRNDREMGDAEGKFCLLV